MLGGSILLDKYSRHIADDIEAGGFTISASLFNVIEGGNHVAMAKTACLTALEFTNGLHTHRSRTSWSSAAIGSSSSRSRWRRRT